MRLYVIYAGTGWKVAVFFSPFPAHVACEMMRAMGFPVLVVEVRVAQ